MRKKSITKAMAYLLAGVTAMSSISGAMPVMAAEAIMLENIVSNETQNSDMPVVEISDDTTISA